jgi:hypothetical protein
MRTRDTLYNIESTWLIELPRNLLPKLSGKVWKHIRERHPEMSSYESRIKDVVLHPELILKGENLAFKAIRLISQTHFGSKYLVVVYLEKNGRKDIITAYFTSDLNRIKGEIIWKA